MTLSGRGRGYEPKLTTVDLDDQSQLVADPNLIGDRQGRGERRRVIRVG